MLALHFQALHSGVIEPSQWTPGLVRSLASKGMYAVGRTANPPGVFVVVDGRPLWSYFGGSKVGVSTVGADSTLAAGVDGRLPASIQVARVGRGLAFGSVKIPKGLLGIRALTKFLGRSIRTPNTPFYLKGDGLSVGWTLPMIGRDGRVIQERFGTVMQSLTIVGVTGSKPGDIGPLILVTADWRNAGILSDISPSSGLRLFVAKR